MRGDAWNLVRMRSLVISVILQTFVQWRREPRTFRWGNESRRQRVEAAAPL